MTTIIARRRLLAAFGGAAAWPVAARAQQRERIRRIGVLMDTAADDPLSPVRIAVFMQGLHQAGWSDGRNVQIDYRFSAGDADLYRRHAAELIALAPEVILIAGGTAVGAVQQATRTVPIVFVYVSDPVTRGLIASLARPGGNATGFLTFEYAISGKWLDLLKQMIPRLSSVAVLRDATQFSGVGQMASIQSAAAPLGVELTPVNVRDAEEIKRGLTALARAPNVGLIVASSSKAEFHRRLIIDLAARLRLPSVYPNRSDVTEGALLSYGPDILDQFRRAAGYVDRILKGAKPADLPVQAPTKYELVVNLKTAKAIGLDVPASVLARADEVIE